MRGILVPRFSQKLNFNYIILSKKNTVIARVPPIIKEKMENDNILGPNLAVFKKLPIVDYVLKYQIMEIGEVQRIVEYKTPSVKRIATLNGREDFKRFYRKIALEFFAGDQLRLLSPVLVIQHEGETMFMPAVPVFHILIESPGVEGGVLLADDWNLEIVPYFRSDLLDNLEMVINEWYKQNGLETGMEALLGIVSLGGSSEEEML